VRIDQPPDPAGDVAREGDPVPDEPVLEHPAPVAGDTEPAEPRTRHEHADPSEPTEPSEESPPDAPSEPPEDSPPDERDSPETGQLDRPADSPSNGGASDTQEELPNGEAPTPNVDEESTQPDEAPGPPPDPEPAEKPDGPDDEDLLQPTRDATSSADRIRPLNDEEWAEHLTEVRDGLAQARREGLITSKLYTIDPDRREWTANRNRIQGSLVADLFEKAKDVPCDHSAIIAGGLGGAGKTTVLTQHAGIDLSRYLMINPDDIKEEMARRGMIPKVDGLSPMEAADLAHEESSYIAKRLALRASAEGKNIIWDITMSSTESTEARIKELRDAEYTRIDGLFVDIPVEMSVERTDSRHREGHESYRSGKGLGGRYVPPEVITSQRDPEWSCQNRRTYESVKDGFDNWSIYDNSGDHPVLIESPQRA